MKISKVEDVIEGSQRVEDTPSSGRQYFSLTASR